MLVKGKPLSLWIFFCFVGLLFVCLGGSLVLFIVVFNPRNFQAFGPVLPKIPRGIIILGMTEVLVNQLFE